MRTLGLDSVTEVIVRLKPDSCITCGCIYGVTEEFDRDRRSDGESWYAPCGHQIEYTETDVQRVRRENQRLREHNAELVIERNRLADDVLDKAKEVAKLRRHAKAGLCPDCRRHFTNLERHIRSKHQGEPA